MDDSGSRGLSSLRTVFDIDRLAERLTFGNFWLQQEQLAVEMRVPYLLFHSHLPEDQ